MSEPFDPAAARECLDEDTLYREFVLRSGEPIAFNVWLLLGEYQAALDRIDELEAALQEVREARRVQDARRIAFEALASSSSSSEGTEQHEEASS